MYICISGEQVLSLNDKDLMLKKREIFRQCFDNFDYDKIAANDDEDVERIVNYSAIELPRIPACFPKHGRHDPVSAQGAGGDRQCPVLPEDTRGARQFL